MTYFIFLVGCVLNTLYRVEDLYRCFLTFSVFWAISISQALPPLSAFITRWHLFPDQRLLLTSLLFLKAAAESPSFFHLWCADSSGSRAIHLSVYSLFLFWPRGRRKERMCLVSVTETKRRSFVNDVMTRVGWRSRNPSRARCHMGKPSRIQQKRLLLNDATVFHYGVHYFVP